MVKLIAMTTILARINAHNKLKKHKKRFIYYGLNNQNYVRRLIRGRGILSYKTMGA